MYDKIHELGKMLKDSRPTYDNENNYIAPKTELSEDAQIELEFHLNKWLERYKHYLDSCGIKKRKPLWHYDSKNPKTHPSSPEFKYAHLIVNEFC